MDSIVTQPDQDMVEVKKHIENTIWIYKSSGGWNNKELQFTDNGKVIMDGNTMGYWGIQGRALYFQVDNNNYRKESLVGINVLSSRIDWLKINFKENVYMVAKKMAS